MGAGGEKNNLMSPSTGAPFGRRAAPEPNKRALYVGGLDPRVTEDVLRQIFETTGHVQSVKIIPDKNVGDVLVNNRGPWCLCFFDLPSLPGPRFLTDSDD
jgi:nucleolysin TIA-1/TIAR